MKEFFTTIPRNFFKSFEGYKILLHITAVVLTYILLKVGFDWYWFSSMSYLGLKWYFFPAVLIGAFMPLVLPIILIGYGHVIRHNKVIMTGWAVGQGALLGSAISSIYKAFTGRIPPSLQNISIDISHGFQFGFLRNGIFWGWPSSHTTIAFAMAVTFCVMYRKNKLWCLLAILYALYIGIGVSTNIHWFSEFVAGSLIGTAIGLTVGKYWHKYTNR